MSWESVRADVFCESVRDGTHDTPKEAENGYKLVTAKHIRDGQVYPEEAYNISEKDYLKICERSKVEQWDVLMSMIGNGLGRSAVVKEPASYAIKNLALFKVGDEVKARWLHYFLSSEVGQGMIYNSLQGSGQPFISLNLLRAFPIPTPQYAIMKSVVDIVSKYDELIENNQKQIKLLEEAAQRLYKEWFVDLRFPGHETTPITDGIPEGWTEGTLVDLAVFERGKTITKGQVNEGNVPVVAGGLEPAYYHDTPNTDAPVITVSGSGANAGFTRMYYTEVWASDCSYIDVSVTHDIAWIYCFLKENKASIDSMQKGAAQPHVYAKDLNAMKVVVPCDSLMEQFRTAAEPMFSKIGKLEMQIKMLTEARDRLLPKLMNGEIEV